MVALLLTLEDGGTSLCSPSREYVSWLGVRRHTETLPSCSCRSRVRGSMPGAAHTASLAQPGIATQAAEGLF